MVMNRLDDDTVTQLRANGYHAKCFIRHGMALFFIYRWKAGPAAAPPPSIPRPAP